MARYWNTIVCFDDNQCFEGSFNKQIISEITLCLTVQWVSLKWKGYYNEINNLSNIMELRILHFEYNNSSRYANKNIETTILSTQR